MRITRKLFTWAMALYLLLSPVYAAAAFQQGRPQSNQNSKKNHGVLHLKFDETYEVAIKHGRFVSQSGQDLQTVNNIIDPQPGRTSVSKMFTADEGEIETKRQQIRRERGRLAPDLGSYFRVRLVGSQLNSLELSQELKRLPFVAEAYPEPLPAQNPSPNFSSNQTHFKSAANFGLGINDSAIYPGVSGNKVAVADVEYSWNTNHEDVSDARASGAVIANGNVRDPFSNTNHGTAVTGIINGDQNSFGINGIAPDAMLKMVNTYSTDRGWDVANAVYLAANNLSAGDVILIEQQTWAPDGYNFVPVEWVPAVYDAIKFATDSGITVIEPAGNSGLNLDSSQFGSTFPMGKPDSGAIIVGAGTACGYAPHRARLSFSNYGSRVNLQGYGECVTTSGYGSLYSSEGIDAWYTNTFNGTSSASALVAGVAAALSSTYEQLNGAILSPVTLRSYLIQTGTAQDLTWSSGHIGPLPNLRAAVKLADLIGPSQPNKPTATLPRVKQVKLTWQASTDNVQVLKYEIYRNNKLIKTVTSTSFLDKSGLRRRKTYAYKIRAVDVSGRKSVISPILYVKTR